MVILFLFFYIIFIGLMLWLFQYKFFLFLKEKYPTLWNELGSPTLFFNKSIKNSIETFKFLKRKEYLKINDPNLTKLSKILFNFYLFYIVSFLFFFIYLFIYIQKNKY